MCVVSPIYNFTWIALFWTLGTEFSYSMLRTLFQGLRKTQNVIRTKSYSLCKIAVAIYGYIMPNTKFYICKCVYM